LKGVDKLYQGFAHQSNPPKEKASCMSFHLGQFNEMNFMENTKAVMLQKHQEKAVIKSAQLYHKSCKSLKPN
jgi:hypothetical protein